MSKKKKKKNQAAGFPKHIAGVKVPKRFRKFADSPVGSAIIAEAIIHGSASIARTPRVRRAAGQVGDEASQMGAAGLHFVNNVARTALLPVIAAAQDIVESAEDYRGSYTNGKENSKSSSTKSGKKKSSGTEQRAH